MYMYTQDFPKFMIIYLIPWPSAGVSTVCGFFLGRDIAKSAASAVNPKYRPSECEQRDLLASWAGHKLIKYIFRQVLIHTFGHIWDVP